MGRNGDKSRAQRTKDLDKAVRKIESKEKRQESRGRNQKEQTRSTGRTIRDGWKGGANQ